MAVLNSDRIEEWRKGVEAGDDVVADHGVATDPPATHDPRFWIISRATGVSDAIFLDESSANTVVDDVFSDKASSNGCSTASSPPPSVPPHGWNNNNNNSNNQVQGEERENGQVDNSDEHQGRTTIKALSGWTPPSFFRDVTLEGEEESEHRIQRIIDSAEGKPVRVASRAKNPGSKAQRIGEALGCMRV